MSRRPRRGVLALLAAAASMLLGAGAAHAAPPPNDAASAAVEVAPFLAENGTSADRLGIADLGEAGPDAGTPRCLGPKSFQRTAWFRVPGGPLQRLRLDAFVSPGQPDEVPEIAAYVQSSATAARLTEPQACDGPEAGSADAGVQFAVPAGRSVLVQVGLPAGSRASQVILSVDADPLRQLAPPDGDDPGDRIGIPFGKVRSVPLGGATLGEADPAQPACPAGHTVWRMRKVRQTGEQVVQTRGRDVSTLSAFVGKRPTGDGVRACATRSSSKTETLTTRFTARKGDVAWIRLGADEQTPQAARTAFSGPCDRTPLQPLTRPRVRIGAAGKRPRTKKAVRLRIRTDGPCLARARISVKKQGRVVARGSAKRLVRGLRTVSLRRVRGARAPRGAYRVTVSGRVPTGKKKAFGITRTVRLR